MNGISRGKPSFVLVHGAFHGGWCWQPIAKILRAAEHDVYTPTQTGLGERRHLLSRDISMETFVLDILNVLLIEDLNNVVLVGHSFGGRSISGVADRAPDRVRRIVYIDAGLAPHGGSRLDAMLEDARAQRIQSSQDFDGGISVPPPPASRFGMSEPDQIAWVERFLTPQPLGAERTPLVLANPLGNGRPVTFVHCTQPALPVTASSAAYARSRRDWQFIEFPGGHNAIITHAPEMARLLLDEAAL
jgi:pimeloyl-ACP methyl ester carboxylesterase